MGSDEFDMGHATEHGPVLVDGEPPLVVDATAAALRGHGLDARVVGGAPSSSGAASPVSLVLLVPAGAEAACRGLVRAGRSGLPWGAIVDGLGPATGDTLTEGGASWVLAADTGLTAVVEALGGVAAGADAAAGLPGTTAVRPEVLTAGSAARLATLTDPERLVLDAMADGRSLSETAARMDSTVATVRAHRRSVRAKLGVRSQLAAVALLIRQEAEDDTPELRGPRATHGSRGAAGLPRPGAPVPNMA